MERPQELTVEQLAARVEMSVRNIREWQALGVLPPPVRRGRVGFYNHDHIARVRRIKELKADGFRLDLIARILETDQTATSADLQRAASAFLEPFHVEDPLTLTSDDLLARLELVDEAGSRSEAAPRPVLEGLAEAGLIQLLDDGQVRVPSPRLLEALEEMVRLGLSIEKVLGPLEEIAHHHRAIAEILIGIYRDQVWEPFVRSGMPQQGWPDVVRSAEHLRPALYDAVLAAFRVAMDTASRHALVENADRIRPGAHVAPDPGFEPGGD